MSPGGQAVDQALETQSAKIVGHLAWRVFVETLTDVAKVFEVVERLVDVERSDPLIIFHMFRRTYLEPPAGEIVGKLAKIRPVSLELVLGRKEARLRRGFVDRYHYLGCKKSFGCRLRSFVVSKRGYVGCVLLAGAARSIGVRDRWVGWTKEQRSRNLPWVVNNTRFLVFPWVRIKGLVSHILGQVARRVRKDWLERWGYEPVLLETFVDPLRYQGTCYRAAGWTCLGHTTGEGLVSSSESGSEERMWQTVKARGPR